MKERGLSILDALENLNILVEADSLDEIELSDNDLLISHKEERENGLRDIYWVRAGPDEQTLGVIRETFRTVHDYLLKFYDSMKIGRDTKRLVEGINTVMVLVGEAAKKLDRFGALFKQRVSEFQEYKELQNFYRSRVIKESFQEFAKAPIPKEKTPQREVLPELSKAEEDLQELLSEEPIEEIAGVHLLDDLEVVKRDHLYELFYLKNEAGHHFYTYTLARNIKLACDFGEFTDEYFGEDPLLQIKNWEDKILHLLAQKILLANARGIDLFYKEALKYREMECVTLFHNALMALMLAANPRNMIRQFSLKGSHLYFHDFLLFLREGLHNREYQKFLIYSPPASKPFFQDMLDLIHAICFTLYTTKQEDTEVEHSLKKIVEMSKHKKEKNFSQTIMQAYKGLSEVLKKHPNGPLFQALDLVREEEERLFDPFIQGNLPCKEWTLLNEHHEVIAIRMACPTLQELIHRAYILEEFKTFLRSLKRNEVLLFINFQDRTSWKEHARSFAVEDLSRQAEFADHFTVVTLAKDTEFYNQSGVYQDLEDAEVFIDHFIQHLGDEMTGYYFSQKMKKKITSQFLLDLLKQIHHTFFQSQEVLSFIERLDFILIAYHFIELKLIEIVKPKYITLSSKDGLDIGGTSSVGLIALLMISKGKTWNEKENDRLNAIVFAPTLLHRERAVHPERIERLISMIELLEKSGDYLKDFKNLFNKETLKSQVKLI